MWAIGKLIAYVHRKRQEPKPAGAMLPPVRRRSERRARGVVLGASLDNKSPISELPCVGWAAELTATRWFTRHVMLRDGQSFGFDVRLEDGRIARVPAGPIRLHPGGQEHRAIAIDSYLTSVDPAYASADEEPAIPYEDAVSIDIRPGDHVEVFGELQTVADPDAAQTYRGTSAMVLAPADVPLIRRV